MKNTIILLIALLLSMSVFSCSGADTISNKDLVHCPLTVPKDHQLLFYTNCDGERISIYRAVVLFSKDEFILTDEWTDLGTPLLDKKLTIKFINEKIPLKYFPKKLSITDVKNIGDYCLDKGTIEYRLTYIRTKKGNYLYLVIIQL